MSLRIEKCTEADMGRFFEILSLAFGHEHEYVESVFPDHASIDGRAAGAERMLAIMKADIYATFLKVVNDQGEMIAAAKWNIYDHVLPPEFDVDGSYWKNDEDKEYAQHMFRMYLVPRRKTIKDSGGHLVSLDLMIVDPKHQRQGAGRMLVKWGTKIADDMGVETVVEATNYGRGLYLQEGFEVLEDYELPLPDKWADRPRQRFWWMRRPVMGKAN